MRTRSDPLNGGRGMTEIPAWGASRSEIAQVGKRNSLDYRERVLDLLQDKDLQAWWSALMAGVEACDRTCMRLFAEVLRLVDKERDLVLVFVNRLGYDNPDKLAETITRLRGTEAMDAEALLARAEKFVRDEYARRGKTVVIVDSDKEVADVADVKP